MRGPRRELLDGFVEGLVGFPLDLLEDARKLRVSGP